MAELDATDIMAILDWTPKILILVVVLVLAVLGFRNRHSPRVGGKIGRRRPGASAMPVPEGFARVDCREIVNDGAPADPSAFADLKTYVRDGAVRRPGLVNIYQVAGCDTCVEFDAAAPDYERIGPTEALALLRELPDMRLVLRLHLADAPSFLDPWARRVTGRDDIVHLGNATNFRLIVLYRPDRRLGRELAVTLLHEWLHLVAFKYWGAMWLFRRANKVEPLAPPPIEPVSYGDPKTSDYETWCDLGETLLGDDEERARQTALAAPLHALILWRAVEKAMRKVPKKFTSTRHAVFAERGEFMRRQIAPLARAAGTRRRARLPPGT